MVGNERKRTSERPIAESSSGGRKSIRSRDGLRQRRTHHDAYDGGLRMEEEFERGCNITSQNPLMNYLVSKSSSNCELVFIKH